MFPTNQYHIRNNQWCSDLLYTFYEVLLGLCRLGPTMEGPFKYYCIKNSKNVQYGSQLRCPTTLIQTFLQQSTSYSNSSQLGPQRQVFLCTSQGVPLAYSVNSCSIILFVFKFISLILQFNMGIRLKLPIENAGNTAKQTLFQQSTSYSNAPQLGPQRQVILCFVRPISYYLQH